ncbi:hypothetical protein, partial [Cronobacter sakazakii]|uniref:hypothetical protein n=1 Tax=Cronobacter sakazakii TaxID=28141 RepID=UPI000D51B886
RSDLGTAIERRHVVAGVARGEHVSAAAVLAQRFGRCAGAGGSTQCRESGAEREAMHNHSDSILYRRRGGHRKFFRMMANSTKG